MIGVLHVQEKVRATPGAAMRRRSRMSDIMYKSAPEPYVRGGGLRSLSELASPDGSADMELGGSPSSDDEDDVQVSLTSSQATASKHVCI